MEYLILLALGFIYGGGRLLGTKERKSHWNWFVIMECVVVLYSWQILLFSCMPGLKQTHSVVAEVCLCLLSCLSDCLLHSMHGFPVLQIY